MRKTVYLFLLSLALLKTCASSAQVTTPAAPSTPSNVHYYRLDFVFKELDASGHVLNSRNYAMTMSTKSHSQGEIRSGAKVPIRTGDPGSQYTYYDVGVNLDAHSLEEIGDKLSISLTADISSIPPDATADTAGPVIRQYKWNSDVLVPLGVPTIVFSADDATSKGRAQLQLNATLVK